MDKYEYQTWENKLLTDALGHRPGWATPTYGIVPSLNSQSALKNFLLHQLQECERATKSGCVDDPRWKKLRSATEEALLALETTNKVEIAIKFLSLGESISAFSQFSIDDIIDDIEVFKMGIKAIKSETKRTLPLARKNHEVQKLRTCAQELAKSLWAKGSTARIGEMCNIVWAKLHEALKDHHLLDRLPDKPDGIKLWLREVAPSFAKKGGRPKKGANER